MQIGKLEEGIACSAWSPDQEFLVICTRDRHLVLMNKVSNMQSMYPSQLCHAVTPVALIALSTRTAHT